MAIAAATFLARYPEFSSAATALLNVELAAAELRISDNWGARRDEMVMLSTAAALADSPQGRNARLDPKRNVYAERFNEELQAFCCMFNRAG